MRPAKVFGLSDTCGEQKMPDEDHPISDERITLYRGRAAEAREQAKSAATPEIRANLLSIADSYDHLADSIAELEARRPKE